MSVIFLVFFFLFSGVQDWTVRPKDSLGVSWLVFRHVLEDRPRRGRLYGRANVGCCRRRVLYFAHLQQPRRRKRHCQYHGYVGLKTFFLKFDLYIIYDPREKLRSGRCFLQSYGNLFDFCTSVTNA